MDKAEIADTHDYNLNIRRYVDNTPEPEPEDVQAHLIGGVPKPEVFARAEEFGQFGVDPDSFFQPDRPGYLSFRPEIPDKPTIKKRLDADPALAQTFTNHHRALEEWWTVAREDFALLRDGKTVPDTRRELLTTLKAKLIPLGVLDEFQSAGVFVNWWLEIRYDLKTIVSTGWHHSLIPDEYLIAEFFQEDADAIEALEAGISEAQSELAEAVEAAQEAADYQPEEDEKVTAAVMKKALKALVDDLKGSAGETARSELKTLQAHHEAIKDIENRIKASRAKLKSRIGELELKLQLKRLGGNEFEAESRALIRQVDEQLATLDPANKDDGKRITALRKDRAALEERLARTDALLAWIGGKLTDEEARRLILKKLYDLANTELQRYLNAEQRTLTRAIENLWDKYAVSSRTLESERNETLKTLDGFLAELGYLA